MKEWLTFGAKVMAATFAVVAVIALAIWIDLHETDARDIASIRAMARLAPLPYSARDIHAKRFLGRGDTGYCLKFAAPPAAIDIFLSGSPGVLVAKLEKLTTNHKLIHEPNYDVQSTSNDALFLDTRFTNNAPWFIPPVITNGRKYHLKSTEQMQSGYIIVDDTRHVVYIYATLG
ncbi:MAG TPA: hypothetical protein VGK19_05000 [Capsulimonadaceae bacterium]|jgi:hypothetical protein